MATSATLSLSVLLLLGSIGAGRAEQETYGGYLYIPPDAQAAAQTISQTTAAGNRIDVTQSAGGNSLLIIQTGAYNQVNVQQSGSMHRATIRQN